MKIAIVGLGLIGGSIGDGRPRAGRRGGGLRQRSGGGRCGCRAGGGQQGGRHGRRRRRRRRDRVRVRPGGRAARCSSRRRSKPRRRAASVTDVGSTKGRLVAAAGGEPRFVGGHPVCGSETRGVATPGPTCSGRDMVPHARPGHRSGLPPRGACATCRGSARGRWRSTPTPTTGSWRSPATCRTRSRTCWQTRPARAGSTATIRSPRSADRSAT